MNGAVLLDLFLTFLRIGAVSFGGGYGMISIIRDEVIRHGWLTEEELLNMIAVSESTPGPLAVNMATFVGSTQGGVFGALVSTLGVVLPSFIIILMIAAVLRNLMKYAGVEAFLRGIRPCVVGLILATSITLGAGTLFSWKTFQSTMHIDGRGIAILVILLAINGTFKKFWHKKLSPILLILVSAVLGVGFYGI
ncbi:MAG: chromate transporter [Lachnospiraceae bacterium]|nr:chromate transporter [Lachnospiraceae bacterium]